MPTTVTSTSGNTYHLFQLAEASFWQPEESIRFEELENNLGDGYFSQALYGANTGLRSWKLKLPTLAHTDVLPNTVTDVSGATVSREEYLWNLFCHTKVTGEPFVFTSPRDGQYHLVRFADKELSYQKMRVKIYSTGVELKQVRIPGESVFQLSVDIAGMENLELWADNTDSTGANWTPNVFGDPFEGTGDVIFGTATQNGLPVIRLNSVSTNGKLLIPSQGFGVPLFNMHEAFVVMKVREATFGQTSGVLTDDTVVGSREVLVGTNGTTKFADNGINEYRLNGRLYAAGDYQAPMSVCGIVHIRYTTPPADPLYALQIGKRLATGGTQAEIDIAEIISFSELLPASDANLLTEYLTTKWGIT